MHDDQTIEARRSLTTLFGYEMRLTISVNGVQLDATQTLRYEPRTGKLELDIDHAARLIDNVELQRPR